MNIARTIFHPEDGGNMLSETSVNIRTTWRYIAENGNTHNYLCEELKS
jgi:hypothetical protein